MASNTFDGITAFIDLDKCSDYITFEIKGKTYKVRIFGIWEEPWFCGKDVCDLLGLSKHAIESRDGRTLISILNENDEHCLGRNNLTSNHKTIYVNESGLSSLCTKGNPDFSGAFHYLVCIYVIPTIMRHGEMIAERMKKQIDDLKIKNRELEKLNEELEEVNERAFHKLVMTICRSFD
jgi:prophage antirepressor-like protein